MGFQSQGDRRPRPAPQAGSNRGNQYMNTRFSGQATSPPSLSDATGARAPWRAPWPDAAGIASRWQLYGAGEVVELAADREVISDLSPGRGIWLIRSGILRLQRHAFDGRRQILSLSLPGEIMGYDRQWREGLSVETATRCSLCRIDRRVFDARLEVDRRLRRDFYHQQHDQIERLRWLTWSIGALRPEERLCAFLALSTRFMPCQPLPDGSCVLTLVLARLDIADLLATTVESISRITHGLDEAGVIDIRDPTHFRIRDLKALTGLGRIERTFETMPFRTCHRGDRSALETRPCPDCPSLQTAC